MKARRLIDGAAYGPETLKVMGRAFDEAWQSISSSYSDPQEIESTRLRLAEALLSVSSEDSRNVEALKKGALEVMALRYSQLR